MRHPEEGWLWGHFAMSLSALDLEGKRQEAGDRRRLETLVLD